MRPSNMQLTLDVGRKEAMSFDTYCAGDNAELIAVLKQITLTHEPQMLYCWGGVQVGLSHLLQATCQQATHYHCSSFYLPLNEMKSFGPVILQGLESVDVVCIDNVECIGGDRLWEEALFHCYNQMRDANKSLVIASHCSLAQCPIELADLKSRLSWGSTYHVKALDDNALGNALKAYARDQGFALSDEVVKYLLNRYPRHITPLKHIIQKLATASLVQQHKITVPFIKQVLLA
jgi:DnaA-homolog protein